MRAPGLSRGLTSPLYHSQIRSRTVSESASSRLRIGSSMMTRSPRKPAIPTPAPAARYSPPALVAHRPAAALSPSSSMLSTAARYGSLTRLRTFLPKRCASSTVCEAASTLASRWRARYHAGNKIETYVDLAEPGGMNTASRLISPSATFVRCSSSSRWCAAARNRSGCTS